MTHRLLRSLMTALLALACVAASAAGSDGAARVRIELDDRGQLEAVSRLLSIDRVDGLAVEGEASPRQLAAIAAAGYRWQRLGAEATAAVVAATMCPAGWEVDVDRSWDCYPSYPQYVAFMEGLAAAHPELCRLHRIGFTANQARPHELLVLVVSDHPDEQEDEPEVFLTSSIHGDETTGWVLLMRLAAELLDAHGSDPELTTLVDGVELWINPLANPDGTYFGSDASVSGAIRYYSTAVGGVSFVDGNRNFPDPDDGPHPDGYRWWPETEAMMAFAREHSFALSANLHGGAEVVNYPWDTWARRHADDEWFARISRAYADATHDDGWAGYMRDLDDGITNGWDWYPVAGGRQDFMTYYLGGREITIELSHTKLLPGDQLPAHWQANRRALLGLVATSLEGIRGVVRDPAGRPLAATVEVVGHDVAEDRSWVSTDPDAGDFHRLLPPGTYDLLINAPGFQPLELGGIAVTGGDAVRLDLTLHPAAPRRGRRRAG